jgi:hypothetical protein
MYENDSILDVRFGDSHIGCGKMIDIAFVYDELVVFTTRVGGATYLQLFGQIFGI